MIRQKLTWIMVIAITTLALQGCGRFDRWFAGVTGSASKECVDGVEYLQFTSGASVSYNRDGTIKTCR